MLTKLNETYPRVVGIVLQTIPFQDHHQIISLFSAEWGLLRIIIKYAYAKKNFSSVEALNLVEICLKKGKGDLFQAHHVSLLNSYLSLRKSYACLHASLELLAAIVNSQFVQKPSPILFSLLIRYLEYMPQANSPKNLVSSFKLKILRHDGLIDLSENCSQCKKRLALSRIQEGQFYCEEHSHPLAISLTLSEKEQLKDLAESRSFLTIDHQFLSTELEEKIHSLFAELST
ncbi:DNA repair protein RecO [Chlamydiales bacterium STE3]|nr:DNA repair protein RecO [Chlamydiales bacterium STE3]